MKIKYVGEGIETISSEIERDTGLVLNDEDVEVFKEVFKFLNNKDRDILYLVFISGKSQSSVQKIMNRSQPSLCYDVKRIKRRLQFICYLHSVYDIFVDFLAEDYDWCSPEVLEVLTLMFYTTSYTHSAKVTDQEYLKIRYRFDKAIITLEEKKMWSVYEIFASIRENLNIIKRFYPKGDMPSVS